MRGYSRKPWITQTNFATHKYTDWARILGGKTSSKVNNVKKHVRFKSNENINVWNVHDIFIPAGSQGKICSYFFQVKKFRSIRSMYICIFQGFLPSFKADSVLKNHDSVNQSFILERLKDAVKSWQILSIIHSIEYPSISLSMILKIKHRM